jgi:hypothetical protein
MIYVECKPDKILIHTLDIREITHFGGRCFVCRELERRKNLVAVIDEDPRGPQPSYLKKLKLIKQQNSLKLFYDKENNNKVIMICPRLEEWILKAAKQQKIKLSDYNLPHESNQFHLVVNLDITNFQKLIHTLKKSKNKMLITLKKFISNC